jgi:hypothetical protein
MVRAPRSREAAQAIGMGTRKVSTGSCRQAANASRVAANRPKDLQPPPIPRGLTMREIVTRSWRLMLQNDTPACKTGFLSSEIRLPTVLSRNASGHPMVRRPVTESRNGGSRGGRHMSRIAKAAHSIRNRRLTCNRPAVDIQECGSLEDLRGARSSRRHWSLSVVWSRSGSC